MLRKRSAPIGIASSRLARLLFEIGTEELPPQAAWDGARQLREAAAAAFQAARISHGDLVSYSTPRRIALIAADVAPRQEDLQREVRGPAAHAAFAADGRPTRAAEGFARAQGVAVESLERRATPQGDYVFALQRSAGVPTIDALRDLLPTVAAGLTFPKTMRWGPEPFRFARPIRWIVALLGKEPIPFRFAGLEAGRVSYGHRILSPRSIIVADARTFESALRRRHVLLDPDVRRERIVAEAVRAAGGVGGRPLLDPDLLDESVQLVEWPEAFAGTFAAEFLVLPREVLITVMQHHQKYFAVQDENGALLPAFVAIRNGGTRGLGSVREGNEWVLRARLADARFFFDEDRRRRLEARLPELAGLVVHEKLGTMAEKTQRLTRLAGRLGQVLAIGEAEQGALERAALLSKADLVTQMVRELPELQGVMGSIYAVSDGEPAPVAEALREQYLPRGAAFPASNLGAALALLDKLDTLVTGIAAGLEVSGSQDPYGLRRAAQGAVAIVLDRGLRLDLRAFVGAALDEMYPSVEPAQRRKVTNGVMDLLQQRLRTALIEAGISYDTVDGVLDAGADDLADAAERARALWAFRRRVEFPRLYTAFDRAARILPAGFDAPLRPEALQAAAERRLWESVEGVRARMEAERGAGRYEEALATLAMLADPVDAFFTDVLVMADDDGVRRNRLALLARVVALMRPLADLSRLVVEKEGLSNVGN